MKVLNQYIVRSSYSSIQILLHCEGDVYFITDRGAFGQRDMSIDPISKEAAIELIEKSQK